MSFLNFSGRNKNKHKGQFQPTLFETQSQESDTSNDENEPLDEETPVTVKLKIVAALMIVGFAGYIAFWVQSPSESAIDPSQLKADVLNETQSLQENGPTEQVSIADFNFTPATLYIEKGTTVVWTNKDTVPHNVASDSFSSGTLNPGETFSYTFDQDGIYDYHCSFHPQMKGSIMVGTDPGQTQSVVNAITDDTQTIHGAADMVADITDTQTFMPPLSALTSSEESTTNLETQYTTINSIDGENSLEESVIDQIIATTDTSTETQSNSQMESETQSQTETQTIDATSPEAQHGAAVEPLSVSAKKIVNATKFNQISNSGPEDYLYVGIFGIILFLNRKKLLKFRKQN